MKNTDPSTPPTMGGQHVADGERDGDIERDGQSIKREIESSVPRTVSS